MDTRQEHSATPDQSVFEAPSSFYVRELAERAAIRQDLELYKSVIDFEKAKAYQQIETNARQRNAQTAESIFALDTALNTNDPEQIKSALKNLLK